LPKKIKVNKDFLQPLLKKKLTELLNLKPKLLVDKKILVDEKKKEEKYLLL